MFFISRQSTTYKCLYNELTVETVSYTHLDVYKRQDVYSFMGIISFHTNENFNYSTSITELYNFVFFILVYFLK